MTTKAPSELVDSMPVKAPASFAVLASMTLTWPPSVDATVREKPVCAIDAPAPVICHSSTRAGMLFGLVVEDDVAPVVVPSPISMAITFPAVNKNGLNEGVACADKEPVAVVVLVAEPVLDAVDVGVLTGEALALGETLVRGDTEPVAELVAEPVVVAEPVLVAELVREPVAVTLAVASALGDVVALADPVALAEPVDDAEPVDVPLAEADAVDVMVDVLVAESDTQTTLATLASSGT